MLIDTHVHLDDPRFEGDLSQVFDNMKQAGVGRCITIGADMPTSRSALALAQEHDFLCAALGVHPHEAKSMTQADLAWLAGHMNDPKVVAWGEIGLDYYYDHSQRDVQRHWFGTQLAEAARISKPVVLHVRDAHGEALEILRAQPDLPRCVVHCFSGSAELVGEYEKLGCYISFTGSVTFKNAHKLREAAKAVSPDRIMVETDCPYLAPEPMRGRRNEPAYVAHVARHLADLREMPYEAFCMLTTKNAEAFFGL